MILSPLRTVVGRSVAVATRYAQSMAEAQMLARVTISRGLVPEFDVLTGTATMRPSQVTYVGQARLFPVSSASMTELGDAPQYFVVTEATIPLSAPIPVINDLLLVTDHPDPAWIRALYRIVNVSRSGLVPASRLLSLQGYEISSAQILSPPGGNP